MPTDSVDILAAAIFAVAIIHTFSAKQFERLANRYPRHAGSFHLLGEVEVVFGFWAMVLVLAMALTVGGPTAIDYAESRNCTEPLFVLAPAASGRGHRRGDAQWRECLCVHAT